MPGDTLEQGLVTKFQKKANLQKRARPVENRHSGHSKKRTDAGILRLFEILQNVGKTKVAEQPGRYATAEWFCAPLRRARRLQ